MDIFQLTNRPDSNLLFKSYDPNDPRLGSIVSTEIIDYDSSTFVLLGSPQDIGVARNKGRIGAGNAPDAIRKVLYKMAHPLELEQFGFFDLGNVDVSGSLEEIHDVQTKIVSQLLKDEKLPIILGGGNDISYPDAKSVQNIFGNLFAINIDNHFDVRENEIRNSGTPYRMLLEEGLLDSNYFIEMGCQKPANSYIYKSYLKAKGVKIIYYDELMEKGLQRTLDSIKTKFVSKSVFWGYDMDSVRASDAPGVSAITPIGLTSDQAITIAKFAGKCKETKLFEISEVNPEFDIDDRTTRLAGLMIIHFISSYIFSRM